MTHIIIHTSEDIQNKYLLKLISFLFKREVVGIKNNPDIHIIEAEKGSIGIEKIKMIQKEMMFKPFKEEYQICVIKKAQALTEEAQNALLKTLEEQPNSTAYILLLNNEQNVLPTILSRGIKHYVKEKGEESNETISKPKILSMNLIEKYAEIEKISEKSVEEIIDYLNSLLRYLKEKLEDNIREERDIKEISISVDKIQQGIERLRGNGNKRLVLENIFIQLSNL